MQSMVVAPGDGATFDIVSPVAGANVIVDHRMSHAHSGAMAVLMYSDAADPKLGRGDMILVPRRPPTFKSQWLADSPPPRGFVLVRLPTPQSTCSPTLTRRRY